MKNLNISGRVDKVDKPSEEEFNENWGNKSIPVVVTGLMNSWPAMTKWTRSLFENEFGDIELFATRTNDANDHRLFKVRDYLKYMDTSEDEYPYYLKDCQFHLNTSLSSDYSVPNYFRSCLHTISDKLPMPYRLSWLYIGAARTWSGLHLDIYNTSAWNAVLTGQKIWLFYPPEQEEFLYRGAVNPFKPDFEGFPLFKKASPMICIQKPGEIVYSPSGWWHAVYNEEKGISLTENFINESNYQIVKTKLISLNRIEELAVIDACMGHNI